MPGVLVNLCLQNPPMGAGIRQVNAALGLAILVKPRALTFDYAEEVMPTVGAWKLPAFARSSDHAFRESKVARVEVPQNPSGFHRRSRRRFHGVVFVRPAVKNDYRTMILYLLRLQIVRHTRPELTIVLRPCGK